MKAIATLGIAAILAIGSARAAAPNLCVGGVDSATCVSCADKDCSIGDARADRRAGVMSVKLVTKEIRIEITRDDVFETADHEGSDYMILLGAAKGHDQDRTSGCSIEILQGSFVPPPLVPTLMKSLAPKEGVLNQRSVSFGAYSAEDFISAVSRPAGAFSLQRIFAFQDITLIKTCIFAVRPDFANKRWNQIKLTIGPQDIVL